jgi:hypothetical protein
VVVGTRKQDQRFAGSRVMDNVPRISWEHRCPPSPLGDHYDVGRSELWVVPRTEYRLSRTGLCFGRAPQHGGC